MKTVVRFLAGAALATCITVSVQAQTRIKVGVLTDLSGAYADLSGPGSVVAARLAAADFMAANKGFQVEVVSGDHLNKADVATSVARRWIDQDGIDVIADVPNSAAALAVSEVARDKKRIFLNSGAGTADLTGVRCSPYTVHWTYDTWALAHGTARAMVQQGGTTWFFITADYAFGHAMARDAGAVVQAAGGEVIGQSLYPFPQGNRIWLCWVMVGLAARWRTGFQEWGSARGRRHGRVRRVLCRCH